jgi:hypothetical protein
MTLEVSAIRKGAWKLKFEHRSVAKRYGSPQWCNIRNKSEGGLLQPKVVENQMNERADHAWCY